MRPFVLVTSALVLSTASTFLVLHLRRQELHRSASPRFAFGLALFNVVVFGLLVMLLP